MLAGSLFAGAFATMASGAPQKRQACGDAITPSFHLVANSPDGSAKYPISAGFPAQCSSNLQLYAKTTGDPWNETSTTAFTYSEGKFQTRHTACLNPNGDPVTFTTGGLSASDMVTLGQNPGPGSEYRLQCVAVSGGGRGYWTFGNDDDEFSWSLCDGDLVDQTLGRQVLHWQGTDPSCIKVNLVPERA